MIQRLQTVYFLAIIAICGLSCGGPLINVHNMIEGHVRDYVLNVIYFKVYENGALVSSEIQYLLIALVAVVIGWTLNIIFTYKNRPKQILFTKINFALMLALVVALFAKAFTAIPQFSFGTLSMQSLFGLALIFFMMYLNFRALMLIRRDEALVKDSDRIR